MKFHSNRTTGNVLNHVPKFEVLKLKLKLKGGGDDKARPKMAKFENSTNLIKYAALSVAFFIL